MEKGMLHLHLTVIVLFLLSFSFKTVLLFSGNLLLLEKVRAKTRIAEILMGTLILITGIYLLIITKNNQAYMIVKIILVIAAIPLGIIGLKKTSKLMAGFSLFLFFYIFAISYSRDLALNIGRKQAGMSDLKVPVVKENEDAPPSAEPDIINQNTQVTIENSKAIYTKLCIQCHGPAGNLGAGGAKDLTLSTLTDAQKEQVILNGKGLMAPFKYSLTEQEIKGLVVYVNGFKK